MEARFIPSFDIKQTKGWSEQGLRTVTGTVVYINWEHRYFTCEFECGRSKMRESFKFAEEGQTVKLYRKR